MRSFFLELRRRKVFHSLASYLVAAWLILQVLDVVGPALGLTDRFMFFTLLTLAIGLPVVAVVSWFFEWTPAGLRRESETPEARSRHSSSTFSYVIIAMLIAALAVTLVSREGPPDLIDSAEASTITLAVLPLQAMGVQIDQTGFIEGLHDDLLTLLSRISSIRVISRTSVLQFGDGNHSIPDIGRQLGAGTILEGSVQRSGDRVRVNVQLIDAATDNHLWAEIFERPFEARALFAIQREIAQAIARQLQIALTGDERNELERQPTSNSEAYTAYLLGRQRMGQRTSERLDQAEIFFRRAIEQDPSYAEAWAGLAETIVLQHDYAGLDLDTMQSNAMRAVQRALTLAPGLARAHGILGELRRYNQDFQGAENAFKYAMELNPSDALSSHWFGNMLYTQGRMADSLIWYQRALELDPLSVTISNAKAQALLALGRSEEAAAQYARSTEIDPDFVATYAHLAQLERFVNGRPDKAVELLFQAHVRDPLHSEYPALMAEALLELDAPAAALRWANRATSNAPNHWWPARAAVLTALHRGEPVALEQALDRFGAVLDGSWLALVARRDLLMASGELDAARALFIDTVPDFFLVPPRVDDNNAYLAPALAIVLGAREEWDQHDTLLNAVLRILDEARQAGSESFDISEVEAHAQLGNADQAIELLENETQTNWLNLWWYLFDGPQLARLSNHPRFIATHERIRNQMQGLRDGLDPTYLTPPADTDHQDEPDAAGSPPDDEPSNT